MPIFACLFDLNNFQRKKETNFTFCDGFLHFLIFVRWFIHISKLCFTYQLPVVFQRQLHYYPPDNLILKCLPDLWLPQHDGVAGESMVPVQGDSMVQDPVETTFSSRYAEWPWPTKSVTFQVFYSCKYLFRERGTKILINLTCVKAFVWIFGLHYCVPRLALILSSITSDPNIADVEADGYLCVTLPFAEAKVCVRLFCNSCCTSTW